MINLIQNSPNWFVLASERNLFWKGDHSMCSKGNRARQRKFVDSSKEGRGNCEP